MVVGGVAMLPTVMVCVSGGRMLVVADDRGCATGTFGAAIPPDDELL